MTDLSFCLFFQMEKALTQRGVTIAYAKQPFKCMEGISQKDVSPIHHSDSHLSMTASGYVTSLKLLHAQQNS